MDFLVLYAEISMAFVAFATIVATLRQSFGGRLTQLQYLLFRFYTEVGFILLLEAIIPIALLEIWPAESDVWPVSNYALLAGSGLYLPYYIYRRRKVDAPVPAISLMVMSGYGVCVVLQLLTATKLLWAPSLAMTTYFLLYGLFANIVVFVYFIGTFVETDAPANEMPVET